MNNNYSLTGCGSFNLPGLDNPSGCKPLLSLLESLSIDITGDGSMCNPLGLEVKVSPDEDNIILIKENGLYASGQTVIPSPISANIETGSLYSNEELGEDNEAGKNSIFQHSILLGEKTGSNNSAAIINSVLAGHETGINSGYIGYSVILGSGAGANSSVGYSSSIAIGENAFSSILGSGITVDSIALGSGAGAGIDRGVTDCIFIGRYAGKDIEDSGYGMMAIGSGAGQGSKGVGQGTMLGTGAGSYADGGNGLLALGYNAAASSSNTGMLIAVGFNAAGSSSNSEKLIAIGFNAGGSSSTIDSSVFIGQLAGYYSQGFTDSVALGRGAGSYSNANADMVALGSNAGAYASGSYNLITLGKDSGNDEFEGMTENDYSILIGRKTSSNGYKNSILLGGSTDEYDYISNTASNQFMLAPNITHLRFRSLDYELPETQPAGVSALINTDGVLGWGSAPVKIDGTPISGGTSGGILFQNADGEVSQDVSNLFWDDANNRLGIGTNEPTQKLDVNGNIFIRGRNSLYVGSTNNRITSDGGSFSITGGTDATLIAAGSLLAINSSRAILNVPTHIGSYNNTPTAFLHVAASTTDRASLRLSTGVAPTSPNAGDVWNDGTSLNINISNLSILGTTGRLYLPGITPTTNYINGTGNTVTIKGGNAMIFNTGNEVVRYTTSVASYSLPLGIGSITSGSTSSWLSINAGTTSRAQINLASGVAPDSPNAGDIWNNGTDIILNGTGLKIGNLQTNSNYNRIYETNSGGTLDIAGGVSGLYLNVGSIRKVRLTNGGLAVLDSVKVGSISIDSSTLLGIAASTTSKAQINLAGGVAPTAPKDGDIWFDSDRMYLRVNGVTKKFVLEDI